MGITGNNGVYHAFRGSIALSLNDWRIVSSGGDVGNIVANGGVFASDTAPLLEGDTNEVQRISWVANGVVPISTQISLPNDFDGTQDVLFEAWVASGTTNIASFTLESSWDGGALVSTALTDPAQSATIHKITAVIPNGSIPDLAAFLTLALTPAAHSADPFQLYSTRISYLRRVN